MKPLAAVVAVPVALGAVWALEAILGPILAALVLGPALWVGIVVAGWLVDRRFDAPPPPLPKRTGPVVDVTTRPVSRR